MILESRAALLKRRLKICMSNDVWALLARAFASGLSREVCGRIGEGNDAEKEMTYQMERCGSEVNVDSGTVDTRSRKFGIGQGVEVSRMVE